jgi:hypothetical protein
MNHPPSVQRMTGHETGLDTNAGSCMNLPGAEIAHHTFSSPEHGLSAPVETAATSGTGPPAGIRQLADPLGRRRKFLVGVTVCAATCAPPSAAPTTGLLIAVSADRWVSRHWEFR